jgi:hypothetical protein
MDKIEISSFKVTLPVRDVKLLEELRDHIKLPHRGAVLSLLINAAYLQVQEAKKLSTEENSNASDK